MRCVQRAVFILGWLCAVPGMALTISEKTALLDKSHDKVDLSGLSAFNASMQEVNRTLHSLYERCELLRASGCEDEEVWTELRGQLAQARGQMRTLQELWRAEARDRGEDPEEYALWNHPETTIYSLVSDYGSDDRVYIIPQEIRGMKVSALSKFSVPKEGFQACLEHLLSRLGIGMRQITPWMTELYSMNKYGCGIGGIFSSEHDLELLPSTEFIGYIADSKNMDVRADQKILTRFAHSGSVQIDVFGGKLWLFGPAGEIRELLKIYAFIQSDSIRQEYRVVPLAKIEAAEMIAILKAAFREDIAKDEVDDSSVGLRVVPLHYQGRALFLSGTASLVSQAIDLIKNIEEGIENPTDKTVFWYSVKHSDPKELAELLSQVHTMFFEEGRGGLPSACAGTSEGATSSVKYGNFIADVKTGTLIIVVEKEALPRIKMLLKRLDVPKKMVRLEVLLFERKLSNHCKTGLNLLRLGEEVCKKTASSLSWSTSGILEFLFKGNTGVSVAPSYDLAYQFLMSQEDVRINASPSVVTVNQTPAKIAIVEEMSIAVAKDNEKSKVQYNRAQYGITIKMVPVINIGDEEGKSFISLETDITFDTTGKNSSEHPQVTRRNITNKVRIADGETVIIGGLRCKHASDSQDSIPFLGEIPGVGKLFGMNETADSQTEMFVFITPKILEDPVEKQEKYDEALLSIRPGESEPYLQALRAGEERMKSKPVERLAIEIPAAVHAGGDEYDGR